MVAALACFLAAAVYQDLRHGRIPNRLNLGGLTLGIVGSLVVFGVHGAMSSAAGALVGGAVFLPFYLMHGMGAGDVKLMAAAGSFFAPPGALIAAGAALVSGALLGAGFVIWRLLAVGLRAEPSPEGGGTWRLLAALSAVRKERFPYALAIASGAVGAIWLQGPARGLVGSLAPT